MANENSFFFSDGTAVDNITQLREHLERVDSNLTSHHISSDNNDFANWVRGSISDDQLANKISLCSSVSEVISVLKDDGTGERRGFHTLIDFFRVSSYK